MTLRDRILTRTRVAETKSQVARIVKGQSWTVARALGAEPS